MKKQRYILDLKKKLLISTFLAIVILIIALIIAKIIASSFEYNRISRTFIGLCVMIAIISFLAIWGFIGLYIMFILDEHESKKSYLKSLVEIQNLSTEFTEVKLKKQLSEFIPNEAIHCMARLDENGDVIYYQIKVDFESSTDDYETFLENFEI